MDNNDFSDILNKFSNILKDKDIDLNSFINSHSNKEQKKEYNSMQDFNTNQEPTEKNSEVTDFSASSDVNNSDFSLDIESILKIKDIISKLNQNKNCPRNKLLHCLKPYLENEKQEKLEQYIKIANLLDIAENFDIGINFLQNNKKGYDFILIITLVLLII